MNVFPVESESLYLDPQRLPPAPLLLLAHRPPPEPDGSVQLVLDLQVGRDQERFGGATLPALLGGSGHVSRVCKFQFTEKQTVS